MKLHFISFDVPAPPDYGGIVDVFYKIKNLYEAGVKIYLHCYEYGREKAGILNQYCEEVHYYKRKTGWKGFSLTLPYMMYSRRSEALLENLLKVDAPILFEGVHTAYYLSHPQLAGRHKILRNQNLEQEYFTHLAQRAPNLFKKVYYEVEARLLKRAESRLGGADVFMTVAEHDHDFFKKLYPGKRHEYIPSFQPYNDIVVAAGKGSYALYHGNLGHPENEEAALYLLGKVCPFTDVPFVFAGKNPGPALQEACARLSNCMLIANPSSEDMAQLVAEAQVHLLPTFQPTGLKLKLLHALFHGRHVIVNEDMVRGTGLSALCHVATDATDFIRQTEALMALPFEEKDISARRALILERYDNRKNAQRIITCLQK